MKLPSLPKLPMNPVNRKRIERFKQIKRGYWSFRIMFFLLIFSLVAELFINSRALIVNYQGRIIFPTYGAIHQGKEFGLDYEYEVNYRDLKKKLESSGTGWVLMPIVPYNAYEQDFKDDGTYPPFAPDASRHHYLGTDMIGRDLIARLIYGFRVSIVFSLLITFATYLIGTLLGNLMGYWGGLFDIVFQRVVEIFDNLPFLYIVMILVSILKPDFILFVSIFIFFGWSGLTWGVRALTYRERERDYILAAKAMGASTWRITTVHVLPNVLVIILTALPFAISGNMSALISLDYLGFGLPPPTPSWGELLNQGMERLTDGPWILASIVTAMVLVLVMIAFIGEALRDAFDPKKYTVYK